MIFPDKSDQEWLTVLETMIENAKTAKWQVRIDDGLIPELAALASEDSAKPLE